MKASNSCTEARKGSRLIQVVPIEFSTAHYRITVTGKHTIYGSVEGVGSKEGQQGEAECSYVSRYGICVMGSKEGQQDETECSYVAL